MFPLALVLFNEVFCMTVLFPIVGFLVSFLRGVPIDEAGYMSGILLGVFMVGQIASAKTWGRLSDTYGRRFALISGVCSSGLAMLFFGLSTNFWGCAFFRFVQGLFNGNILVAKTMVAEITDKSNQAKGFALTGFTYGVGLVIGPLIGGLLYDPVNNCKWMHLSEDGAFATRPALLASLVMFMYSNVALAICTIFIKESNLKAKPLPSFVKYIYPCLLKEAEFFIPPPRPDQEGNESAPQCKENEKACEKTMEQQEYSNPGEMEDPIRYASEALEGELHIQPSAAETGNEGDASPDDDTIAVTSENNVVIADMEPEYTKFGYRQAFQHPETSFNLTMYMLLSGADCIVNETVPLWVISSVSAGGFGFTSEKLGFLLLVNAFPCIAATTTFATLCERYADKAGFFRISIFFYGISAFFLPLAYYLPHGVFATIGIILFQCMRQAVVSWCFALCTMLTARSAPEKFIGATMGISQSSCAVCRAIVPFIFTPMFSWSISKPHIYPFNHCLVFVIAAIVSFLCWVRMYMVSTNPQAKVIILEGGYSAALGRVVEGFKNLLGRNN